MWATGYLAGWLANIMDKQKISRELGLLNLKTELKKKQK
jgi:hypothetical protein